MNIGDLGNRLYGIFVGTQGTGDASKVEQKSADQQPRESLDILTQEITDGYAQKQGVIDSAVETREVPAAPAAKKKAKKQAGTTLKKEVKLTSGVTLTENAKDHTLIVSRNDGNGNPQTLAIFDDTTLTLPQSSQFGTPITIENTKMKETITNDGRIELEDKTHGDYQEVWRMYSGWKEWVSDRYVVTKDGAVTGAQFNPRPGAFGRADTFLTPTWQNTTFVDGHENPDGSISADRAGEEVKLTPFVARNYVIS